jgi:hypothetical protein
LTRRTASRSTKPPARVAARLFVEAHVFGDFEVIAHEACEHGGGLFALAPRLPLERLPELRLRQGFNGHGL